MYKHVLVKDLLPYLRRDDYLGGFTATEQAYIRENIGAAAKGGLEDTLIELTYAQLVEYMYLGKLVPGHLYAITNYQTIYSSFAKNSSDKYITWGLDVNPSPIYTLIALALTEHKLMPNVFILDHENWTVQYDPTQETLDDGVKTKGRIYYLQDENLNRATYDFKNVLFEQDGKLWHTFSDSEGNDNSSNCYNNNLCFSYDSIIKVPCRNVTGQCQHIHIDEGELDNDTLKEIIMAENEYWIDYLDLETLTHQFKLCNSHAYE